MLSFAFPCWAQRTYTITNIGTLGGNASGGGSITNNGEVTGFLYDVTCERQADLDSGLAPMQWDTN